MEKENKAVFPELTRECFAYLKECGSLNDLHVDIAASDSNIVIQELHSDHVTIPMMLIDSVAIPIIPGLLANFITKLVEEYNKGKKDLHMETKIIVSKKEGEKSVQLYYSGPADKAEGVLEKIKQL